MKQVFKKLIAADYPAIENLQNLVDTLTEQQATTLYNFLYEPFETRRIHIGDQVLYRKGSKNEMTPCTCTHIDWLAEDGPIIHYEYPYLEDRYVATKEAKDCPETWEKPWKYSPTDEYAFLVHHLITRNGEMSLNEWLNCEIAEIIP